MYVLACACVCACVCSLVDAGAQAFDTLGHIKHKLNERAEEWAVDPLAPSHMGLYVREDKAAALGLLLDQALDLAGGGVQQGVWLLGGDGL